jgi:hypothetical protein
MRKGDERTARPGIRSTIRGWLPVTSSRRVITPRKKKPTTFLNAARLRNSERPQPMAVASSARRQILPILPLILLELGPFLHDLTPFSLDFDLFQ